MVGKTWRPWIRANKGEKKSIFNDLTTFSDQIIEDVEFIGFDSSALTIFFKDVIICFYTILENGCENIDHDHVT